MTRRDSHRVRETDEHVLKDMHSDSGAIAAIIGAICVALLLIAMVRPSGDTTIGASQSISEQSRIMTVPYQYPAQQSPAK